MKLATIALAAFLVVLASSQDARAQSFTLTVTPSSFAFPSGDPDTMPEVQSPMVTVSYKVTGAGKTAWHMAIRATSDLTSVSDTIPVANIRWTATAPLASGIALTTSDQTILSRTGNMTQSTSTVIFYLKNLWTYKVGTYNTTIVFTLSSP
jgi:hypothetical protein